MSVRFEAEDGDCPFPVDVVEQIAKLSEPLRSKLVKKDGSFFDAVAWEDIDMTTLNYLIQFARLGTYSLSFCDKEDDDRSSMSSHTLGLESESDSDSDPEWRDEGDSDSESTDECDSDSESRHESDSEFESRDESNEENQDSSESVRGVNSDAIDWERLSGGAESAPKWTDFGLSGGVLPDPAYTSSVLPFSALLGGQPFDASLAPSLTYPAYRPALQPLFGWPTPSGPWPMPQDQYGNPPQSNMAPTNGFSRLVPDHDTTDDSYFSEFHNRDSIRRKTQGYEPLNHSHRMDAIAQLQGSAAFPIRLDDVPSQPPATPQITEGDGSSAFPIRVDDVPSQPAPRPQNQMTQGREGRTEECIPDAAPGQQLHIASGRQLCDALDQINESRSETKAGFMAHTRLYLLAKKYDVEDLEETCLNRIAQSLVNNLHRDETFDALIKMARIAYDNETKDEDLQEMLSVACAETLEWFDSDDQWAMRRARKISNNKGFCLDVLSFLGSEDRERIRGAFSRIQS